MGSTHHLWGWLLLWLHVEWHFVQEYVYNKLKFRSGFNPTGLMQVTLVLHICAGTCILGSHLLLWVQSKAHPESLEDLLQALCCTDGVTWAHQGIPYVSQLPSSSHVQLLPVMVMGAFIPGFRRKYSFHEYVSAIMFVVGLVIFTLADAQASPDFSILGVVMVVAALVLDAFVGNFQEVIFLRNPATTQHAYVYLVLIFETCATFVGQLSVLCLIDLFGAATTAMVTTAWKAVMLLLSYIIFTKPLSEQHYTSLILLVMGFVLKMMADQSDSKHSSHHKATSLQLETLKGSMYSTQNLGSGSDKIIDEEAYGHVEDSGTQIASCAARKGTTQIFAL
ncbi:unnamed protein product [Sphagnum tenellum]